MSTSNDDDDDSVPQNYTLSRAHGTAMVIAWMMFASTGILVARYGRLVHMKGRVEILGELIWFQIHRLALSIASIATLIGFFLILAQAKGQWVDNNNSRIFAHSILGIIIVCCSQIQIWMAIFRCHPNNRFRFIFNWMHRLTGLLAFLLSIPTIFLIIFVLDNYRNGLIILLSLWSAWVIFIVTIFEIIEYRYRKTNRTRNYEVANANPSENIDVDSVQNSNLEIYNKIKKILFCTHIIIVICVTIPVIIIIWLQDDV